MWNITVCLLGLFLCVYATTNVPGGFWDVDVTDEDVVTAAGHASRLLSKQFASKYHHSLVKLLKAQKQVVAGTNYKMDIIVGMTDCKKTEVDYDNVQTCNYQDGISTYKKCTVIVYRDLKDSHKLLTSGCILASKNDL